MKSFLVMEGEYLSSKEAVIEVVIRSDDDGHEYLIPKELEDKFEALNAQTHDVGEDNDGADDALLEFETLFNHLRMEGNQPPLYAKVGYEKEL